VLGIFAPPNPICAFEVETRSMVSQGSRLPREQALLPPRGFTSSFPQAWLGAGNCLKEKSTDTPSIPCGRKQQLPTLRCPLLLAPGTLQQ